MLRLAARGGLEAVTMRDVAAEAGFANGALTHYFRNKDQLLAAAYQCIYDRTNQRAEAAAGGTSGLAALRRLCLEILPLDEERVVEARVAVSFWGRALHNPDMSALHGRVLDDWRARMQRWLRESRDSGELPGDAPVERVVDELLTALMGAQVNVAMAPGASPPARLEAVLDGILEPLRDGSRQQR
ncbi:TetR/AcrR family transcriptional regulator [Bounagaea algeriensis]